MTTIFSSPKRLEIIDLLIQGERSAQSITTATDVSGIDASRHLQILRKGWTAKSYKEGLYILYRIADKSISSGYKGLRALAQDQISKIRSCAKAFFDHIDGADPINIDELLARSKSSEVILVDVHRRLEFEAGYLPGAISIPLNELSQHISELCPSTMIVAYYCGSYCVLATQAVNKLRMAELNTQRLSDDPLEWQTAGIELGISIPMPTTNESTQLLDLTLAKSEKTNRKNKQMT